jgi:hypothetical protein
MTSCAFRKKGQSTAKTVVSRSHFLMLKLIFAEIFIFSSPKLEHLYRMNLQFISRKMDSQA